MISAISQVYPAQRMLEVKSVHQSRTLLSRVILNNICFDNFNNIKQVSYSIQKGNICAAVRNLFKKTFHDLK